MSLDIKTTVYSENNVPIDVSGVVVNAGGSICIMQGEYIIHIWEEDIVDFLTAIRVVAANVANR